MNKKVLLLLLAVSSSGCSFMLSSTSKKFATHLSTAILNQNDAETVRAAMPAYLVLIDGLIAGDPEQLAYLLAGAKLNGAFATAFVDDKKRSKGLTEKAWEYSQRALCVSLAERCLAYQQPYASYISFLDTVDESDLPVLYAFGSSWANWIQTHSDDWNARADLAKVEATMKRVLVLNESYLQGEPQIYLGVLASILPPALGGKPDLAQRYFEQAIALSKGQNLIFKVLYAQRYARLLFDRQLHDGLLQEVLTADPVVPKLTLMNTIAQQKAQVLLDSADDYF